MRRKAAGTLRVLAHGRSAHSGSAPEKGANALLALASAAQAVAALHDPPGPAHLTSVPTVVRSGDAFNVVPAAGELLCDLRADELETFDAVLAGLPVDVDGVRLESEFLRRWPGMDSRAATAPLLRGRGRAPRAPDPRRRARRRERRELPGAGRSTSRSTGSARAAEARTRPTSTSSRRRCAQRAEVALALADAVLADPDRSRRRNITIATGVQSSGTCATLAAS